MRFFVLGPRILGMRIGASFSPADLKRLAKASERAQRPFSRAGLIAFLGLILAGLIALGVFERAIGMPIWLIVSIDVLALVILYWLLGIAQRLAG